MARDPAGGTQPRLCDSRAARTEVARRQKGPPAPIARSSCLTISVNGYSRPTTGIAAGPVLLLAYQGLRTQEALQLDWRWVDLDRRTIHLARRAEGRQGPHRHDASRASMRCCSGCGMPPTSRRSAGCSSVRRDTPTPTPEGAAIITRRQPVEPAPMRRRAASESAWSDSGCTTGGMTGQREWSGRGNCRDLPTLMRSQWMVEPADGADATRRRRPTVWPRRSGGLRDCPTGAQMAFRPKSIAVKFAVSAGPYMSASVAAIWPGKC